MSDMRLSKAKESAIARICTNMRTRSSLTNSALRRSKRGSSDRPSRGDRMKETAVFDAFCLFLMGGGAQALVAWRRFPTWAAYALSFSFFVCFYAWMTDGLPRSLHYEDVAPWGTGFLMWLPTSAGGHLLAERFGLKRNSIGGTDATASTD